MKNSTRKLLPLVICANFFSLSYSMPVITLFLLGEGIYNNLEKSIPEYKAQYAADTSKIGRALNNFTNEDQRLERFISDNLSIINTFDIITPEESESIPKESELIEEKRQKIIRYHAKQLVVILDILGMFEKYDENQQRSKKEFAVSLRKFRPLDVWYDINEDDLKKTYLIPIARNEALINLYETALQDQTWAESHEEIKKEQNKAKEENDKLKKKSQELDEYLEKPQELKTKLQEMLKNQN